MYEIVSARKCIYYQLRCITCDETLKSVVATEPEELLYSWNIDRTCQKCGVRSDGGEYCTECGTYISNRMQDTVRIFHTKHETHDLITVELIGDDIGITARYAPPEAQSA